MPARKGKEAFAATRRRSLGLLLLVPLLTACGRRGRLRLPEEEPAREPAPERRTEPER